MACTISFQTLLLSSKLHFPTSSSFRPPTPIFFLQDNRENGSSGKFISGRRRRRQNCRKFTGMVQQVEQGSTAAYAKEMERLSAKESLLLAFKDAGGFSALVTGKTTDVQRIDVNERIVSLERLSPMPRPTSSPYLEGRWNFEWFGSGSLGFVAARFLLDEISTGIGKFIENRCGDQGWIPESGSKFEIIQFNIESRFIISSKLYVEGPLRMKEEYVEGFLESPKVNEEYIPQQLRGALSQAASRVQQLPIPIKDVLAGGMKVPLGGMFGRLFMISYLDDEILIIRDISGVPEVLTRLDPAGQLGHHHPWQNQ
ncbi:putative plastid-lipid-associated protein 13, chloroplastic [Orobanche gracilis]